jgi:SRF-type transcription factor (DNA-binding and dimerisation domain)
MKRKYGLLKKAYELAVLCQCDMALIVVPQTGPAHQFSSRPLVDFMNLLERYRKSGQYKEDDLASLYQVSCFGFFYSKCFHPT